MQGSEPILSCWLEGLKEYGRRIYARALQSDYHGYPFRSSLAESLRNVGCIDFGTQLVKAHPCGSFVEPCARSLPRSPSLLKISR